MKLSRVPRSVSLHWRYLHQDLGKTCTEILSQYKQYSKATVCRHMKKPINDENVNKKKKKKKVGRPRILSPRDERRILRVAEQLRVSHGHFTVKRVKVAAGIEHVNAETVRRVFRRAGLRYTHSRKKGVLKRKDLKWRLNFARRIKKDGGQEDLWQRKLAFYLDGAGFAHKYNPFDQARAPRSMAWRKPHDGLTFERTARGSHEGTGGRVAHFICAIAYNRGMILADQYDGRMNGEKFAAFIDKVFPRLFQESSNPQGKLFLQDGDPSQNSKKAKVAMEKIGADIFKIPPRSPDVNPIENTFHSVKEKLRDDALSFKITHENFENFSERCKKTLLEFSVETIDRTIESMPKRIDCIIARRGQRIKY